MPALVMRQDSKGIKRPDPEPRTADDLVPVNQPHTRIPAVRALVPVVPQHKILILPESNGFRRDSRVLHDLAPIGLLQNLAIYVNRTIRNLDRLARKSDDPLDIIRIFFIMKWKYNNITRYLYKN